MSDRGTTDGGDRVPVGTWGKTPEAMEKLSPERAVRLLRAKAAELEGYVKNEAAMSAYGSEMMLAADIALIAGLLADHIEGGDDEG